MLSSVRSRIIIAGGVICSSRTCAQSDKSNKSYENFKLELISTLSKDQVNDDMDDCKTRGKPWNSYHKSNTFPNAIVTPESTEEVSKVLKLCNKHGIPVIPFGGGTSLEGQLLAPKGGVSLDMNNMKNIISFNEVDHDMTVQPGLGYLELNEWLKSKGLWFPLDPGPGASIGGMCACRCSGSTAVRYGSMRENVLNVTAVLSDGTIIKTGSRARKSSAGYDLTRLLIGSEGTLAVITEVTLKLHSIPKHSYALRVSFDDIRDAAATARDTLKLGITIGRCELLDDLMVSIVNKVNPSKQPLPEKMTLLYEVTGPSAEIANEQLETLKILAMSHGGTSIQVARDPEACTDLWSTRKAAIWAAMSSYPDKEPMISDVCVPLSEFPKLLQYAKGVIATSKLPCPIVAHAGDGNVHVVIMLDANDTSEKQRADDLARCLAEYAISLGGTCTGEHGIGCGKMKLLEIEMGEGSMKLMRNIKEMMDPLGILNPGKVLRNTRTTDKKCTSTCL